MELSKMEINEEIVIETIEKVSDPALKQFLKNYLESLGQIFVYLSSPYLFTIHGLLWAKKRFYTHEDEKILADTFDLTEENPKEAAKFLIQVLREKYKQSIDELTKDAVNKLEHPSVEIPEFEKIYRNLQLNVLVNCWTLFEAYLKDLWIYCINTDPKKYIHNVLKNLPQGANDVEGIQTKSISIGLLSKYNFNLSKSLGNILAPKYDFTGIKGIKKAYIDLLGLKSKDLSILDHANLFQLEISRHVIVHNAGKLDWGYLEKTQKFNENFNDSILITPEDFCAYMNCSIETLCNLFLIVDA